MLQRASATPELGNLFTAFTVNVPQLKADIDVEKAATLGLTKTDVANALQVNLGSLYEKGWGVPRDPLQARRLYTLAAASRSEYVARMGRTSLAVMPEIPAGTGRTSSDATASSNLLPTLIIGGIGMLALSALLHSGGSSSSGSVNNFDWDPISSHLDESMRRMQVGCFWNEMDYLRYGAC